MAFESYLTYEEYVSLGGTVSEDAFPIYERKAQRKLDYITFDRIKYLTHIPDEVKEVLTEFINKQALYDELTGGSSAASKYSNGVETIDMSESSRKDLEKEFIGIARQWLPDYLLARSVSFDVESYLQSESNNP